MMVAAEGDTTWARVGAQLRARRKAMEKSLTELAAEHGMSDRTLADLETGRKQGQFKKITITAAEVAYGLEPGSIARAWAGGELVPPRRYEHPYDQEIWETSLPEEMRLALIEACQKERLYQESHQNKHAS